MHAVANGVSQDQCPTSSSPTSCNSLRLVSSRKRTIETTEAISLEPTALVAACSMGKPYSAIKALLQVGCDIDAVDETGRTALVAACSVDNPSINNIELLVNHKADVNKAGAAGDTPLLALLRVPPSLYYSMYAPMIVKLLLDNGADPNIPDSQGNYPLHVALCMLGESTIVNIVDHLLRAGADPVKPNAAGQLPLAMAFVQRYLFSNVRQGVLTSLVAGGATLADRTEQHVMELFAAIPDSIAKEPRELGTTDYESSAAAMDHDDHLYMVHALLQQNVGSCQQYVSQTLDRLWAMERMVDKRGGDGQVSRQGGSDCGGGSRSLPCATTLMFINVLLGVPGSQIEPHHVDASTLPTLLKYAAQHGQRNLFFAALQAMENADSQLEGLRQQHVSAWQHGVEHHWAKPEDNKWQWLKFSHASANVTGLVHFPTVEFWKLEHFFPKRMHRCEKLLAKVLPSFSMQHSCGLAGHAEHLFNDCLAIIARLVSSGILPPDLYFRHICVRPANARPASLSFFIFFEQLTHLIPEGPVIPSVLPPAVTPPVRAHFAPPSPTSPTHCVTKQHAMTALVKDLHNTPYPTSYSKWFAWTLQRITLDPGPTWDTHGHGKMPQEFKDTVRVLLLLLHRMRESYTGLGHVSHVIIQKLMLPLSSWVYEEPVEIM